MEWNYIHNANFNHIIKTRLRSFYFKNLHQPISAKNWHNNSHSCYFCKVYQKLFCTYFVNVKCFLLWDELCFFFFVFVFVFVLCFVFVFCFLFVFFVFLFLFVCLFVINNVSGKSFAFSNLKICLALQTSQNMTIVLIFPSVLEISSSQIQISANQPNFVAF